MVRTLRSWAVALLFVLPAVGLLLAGGPAPSVWSQPPWPTPPPAPPWPTPVFVPSSQVTRVPPEGGWAWVLQPAHPPPFPIVPPQPTLLVPPEAVESPVRLRIEPISLPATLQVRYRPLPLGEAPVAGLSEGRLLQPFRLEAFDAQGRPTTPSLRRPWLLRVRVPAGVDPERLLLARYEGPEGWQPLVTVWDPSTRELRTRIVRLGLFAILEEG